MNPVDHVQQLDEAVAGRLANLLDQYVNAGGSTPAEVGNKLSRLFGHLSKYDGQVDADTCRRRGT